MPRDWNLFYSDAANADLAPEPLLVEIAGRLPPGRALDLACGAGRNALYLASLGWQVTAVDSSTAANNLLRKRALGTGIDVRLADLERGQFSIPPESFDLICDFLYLQRSLFPAIRSGVVSGGAFIGSMLVADPADAQSDAAFRLKPGELRREFTDWKILFYSEAARHGRDRRVASIVARKA